MTMGISIAIENSYEYVYGLLKFASNQVPDFAVKGGKNVLKSNKNIGNL